MIDWDQPLKTRDGSAIEILKTNLKNNTDAYAVGLVLEEGGEYPETWTKDGRCILDEPWRKCGWDLVNVRDGWIALCKMSEESSTFASTVIGATREEAIQYAHEEVKACVRIQWVDGDGLDEETPS